MTDADGTRLPDAEPVSESLAAGPGTSPRSSMWWGLRQRLGRPAPRAHFFWRFVYPAVVVAAAIAVFLLAKEGGEAVLLQEVDVVEESVKYQPDEPGYLELVGATPTLLALHTHNGELAGVTFMARTGIDSGGGIVLLSADLYVVPPAPLSEEGEFLGAAYADGGPAAVERLAESIFGFGFDEVVEIPSDALASSIQPAGPLPYLILDDLVEVGSDGTVRVVYGVGPTDLSAADAAAVYAFRNPDEADVNRLERQKALWESWLGVIGIAEDPAAAVAPFEADLFPDLQALIPYLQALSEGTAVIEIPQMQTVAGVSGSASFYELADEGSLLRERSLELVPWPKQPESFLRPRVQLLDGTGDPSVRDELVDDIVSAGGVITIIGNAPSFGVESTRFAYHRAELVTDPIVNTIAYELGVGMVLVEARGRTPELADITVTLGLDRVAQ